MQLFKDVDSEQFWLTCWSLATMFLLVLITIITISSYFQDVMLGKLIEDGHDPMELACLFDSSDTMKIPCLILAQAKAKVMLEKNNVPR